MRSALACIVCSVQLSIRELQAEDVPCAAALLSNAFAPPNGYNIVQQRLVQSETEAGLYSRLGESLVLVAEQQDGALVGSVEVFTPSFLEGKAVRFWNASLPLETYVSALAVKLGCRRYGVASSLMEDVEQRAWGTGGSVVSLQVDATNAAAVSLYRRLGYKVVGRDSAVTTPSSNPLVANFILGGAKERSLLVLQKARPEPEPLQPAAAEQRLGRIARWIRRGRTAIARASRLRMNEPSPATPPPAIPAPATPPPPPPPPRLQAPSLLPLPLQRRWRRQFGCDACEGSRSVGCPRCDGLGGYEAMGGVAVACKSCRGTGRVVCRACFVGDGYDIEAIRRDMGVPD